MLTATDRRPTNLSDASRVHAKPEKGDRLRAQSVLTLVPQGPHATEPRRACGRRRATPRARTALRTGPRPEARPGAGAAACARLSKCTRVRYNRIIERVARADKEREYRSDLEDQVRSQQTHRPAPHPMMRARGLPSVHRCRVHDGTSPHGTAHATGAAATITPTPWSSGAVSRLRAPAAVAGRQGAPRRQ